MKNITISIIGILLLFSGCSPQANTNEAEESNVDIENSIPEKVSFWAQDSIRVYGYLYAVSDTSPCIVLCHQARFNKYEYREIAPQLNALGFNCLAIDQRSGGMMNDSIPNETVNMNYDKLNSFSGGQVEEYLSAQPDIEAAIDFVSEKYNQKVILWGSSYSSTHALYQGIENDKVRAVIAFSPGNYYNEAKGNIEELLSGFTKPLFVTSSKQESKQLTLLLAQLPAGESHVQFIPSGKGQHGSKALWNENQGHEEYWQALARFLKKYGWVQDKR